MVGEAAALLGGRSTSVTEEGAVTVRGDLGHRSDFRPDVLLSLPGRVRQAVLPLDAKYKRYDRHGVSAADVHQVLT
ncbi:hypothetical protein ACFTY8_01050 [Streptomyces mirabilis]|uniref:hypothetical protein n=1 Tax=Streptomyces mirabilis TaxID=68239 RepID=UPI00362776A1